MVGCSLAAVACHGHSPTEPTPGKGAAPFSLTFGDWRVLYQVGSGLVWVRPHSASGGGWSADVPSNPAESINEAMVPVMRALDEGQTLSVSYDLACDPGTELNAAIGNGPGADANPASMSFELEAVGDDGTNMNGRYYAGRVPLVCGMGQHASVSLNPSQWTSVDGRNDPTHYRALLAAVWQAGVGFGGRSFAAHGVQVASGRATFRLVAMEVQ